MTGWAAYVEHRDIFKSNLAICLNRLVYNSCVLSAMTYGAETCTLTKQAQIKLAAAQTKMERSMLNITCKDRKTNIWVRERKEVIDIINTVRKMKWSRAGQGRAGQGRAGQGRAGQCRAVQGRAGQGRAGRAGQGRAGQGRAGQGISTASKTTDGPRVSPLGDHMTIKDDKGDRPSGGETTWTNTGAKRYGRGQHKTG